MVYSIEQAETVASQLEKFTTSLVHQLSFWLDEVAHSLKVIDDYPRGFAAMRDAQRDWIAAHETVVQGYCRLCGGACEFSPNPLPPSPPKRIDSHELEGASRRLKDAG